MASELPIWFKARAKEIVVDRFIESMQNYPEFYKVTKVTVEDDTLDSGQAAAFITVHFDDSKKCSERQFIGKCIPLESEGKNYVFCYEAMTDCKPSSSQKETVTSK